jgi:hypothetical protein
VGWFYRRENFFPFRDWNPGHRSKVPTTALRRRICEGHKTELKLKKKEKWWIYEWG